MKFCFFFIPLIIYKLKLFYVGLFNEYLEHFQCGGSSNAGDLEKQPFYQFIQKTYIAHPFVLGVLLYAMGGFPFLVWGMVRVAFIFFIINFSKASPLTLSNSLTHHFVANKLLQGVRIIWVYHITWLVNSACHVWGKQAWNTGDLSRNNWYYYISIPFKSSRKS